MNGPMDSRPSPVPVWKLLLPLEDLCHMAIERGVQCKPASMGGYFFLIFAPFSILGNIVNTGNFLSWVVVGALSPKNS